MLGGRKKPTCLVLPTWVCEMQHTGQSFNARCLNPSVVAGQEGADCFFQGKCGLWPSLFSLKRSTGQQSAPRESVTMPHCCEMIHCPEREVSGVRRSTHFKQHFGSGVVGPSYP